jgi:hypothetical protein
LSHKLAGKIAVIIRNYAPSTAKYYVRSVADFVKHFNKPPDKLGPREIRRWQLCLLNERGVKLSTYIQAVCGLRLFYCNTLNRKIDIDRIPLPPLPASHFEPELAAKYTRPVCSGIIVAARGHASTQVLMH